MNRFLVVIAAVVLVCAVWIAGWLYVAGRVEAEIEALARADGVTQPRLSCASLSVGGFPFLFSPRCADARIDSGDVTVSLPRLEGSALFYRPTHVQLFAAGPARIEDAFNGTVREIDWSDLRASIRLEGDRLARASLVASDLAVSDRLFGETLLARAEAAELHLLGSPGPESGDPDLLDLYLRLEDADIPAFEIARGTLTLDAQASGVPQMGDWGHPDLLWLWQREQGELTLRGLEAAADDIALRASGTARLDDNGLVNGTLSVSARGLGERFEAIAADPIGAVMLGAPDAEGNYSQAVTARAGTLFVGIIPVQRVPPLF